jgi:hypothetical protein
MLHNTHTINIYIFRHCYLSIFQGKSNGQFLSFIFIYMHHTLIFPFFSHFVLVILHAYLYVCYICGDAYTHAI